MGDIMAIAGDLQDSTREGIYWSSPAIWTYVKWSFISCTTMLSLSPVHYMNSSSSHELRGRDLKLYKQVKIVYAKLFKHVICDEDYKALQLGLNALQDWSNKWLLKLNILKCKTVSFFGRNINKNYTYSLHGTQLERLDHMKDLGVIFRIRYWIKLCATLQRKD